MVRKLLVAGIVLFSFSTSYAQINKGQYMVGGNFSYDRTKQDGTKSQNFSAVPNVGYFVIDKLAVGLDFAVAHQKDESVSLYKSTSVTYGIAPFARYYVLPTNKRFNVFAEGSYGLGKSHYESGPTKINWDVRSYSISAGPVFFVTPNVGLELNVGYANTTTKSGDSKSVNKGLQTSVGFQIHLGKGK